MGREIRRVPPNWQHPKEEKFDYRTGKSRSDYKPLHDRPYIEAITEWIKDHEAWERGEHEGQIKYGNTKEQYPHYANYGGNAPDVEYYRPNWKPEEMTWYQVYETVSEGTPVTPPFATQEELVEYLATKGTFWDESPWTREQAKKFVFKTQWVPSLTIIGGVVKSGAAIMDDL